MGLLRRRLIFAKDFDMNKFSMDKIWPVSTLEDTRWISTWPKSFCLFTAGLYFGDVLHNGYINFLAALALYALGQWLFITALSSWQCLYQRELVGPMRWVKVFFCYIDRWLVFEKRQDRLFHVQNSTLFDDMHRKPIDCERWNETAISCWTQLFNGFWIIINRRINCPTIACPCMSTELLFFTIRKVVYSVTIREKYCTFGTTIALWKNLSVTRRFGPQTLKIKIII